MIQNHKATVTLVVEGKAYYIKFWLKKKLLCYQAMSYLRGEVAAVKEDYAKYAVLTSGIQFQLHDSKEVLSRWEQSIKAVLSTEKPILKNKNRFFSCSEIFSNSTLAALLIDVHYL